jgi:hypothetical protein
MCKYLFLNIISMHIAAATRASTRRKNVVRKYGVKHSGACSRAQASALRKCLAQTPYG